MTQLEKILIENSDISGVDLLRILKDRKCAPTGPMAQIVYLDLVDVLRSPKINQLALI